MNPGSQSPLQNPVSTPTPATIASGEDPGRILAIVSLIIFFTGLNLIGLILAIIANKRSKAAGYKNTLAVVMIWIHAIWVALGGLVFLVFLPLIIVGM